MKKALCVFLALVMTFTISVPVFADGGSMSNFAAKNIYRGSFTDVASSNWAAPSVSACYELGIMYGSSETKFNPSGNLTVAEAVVIAVRVNSIYSTGETAVLSGSPWYQPYVDYAVSHGLISSGDFNDYNAKITREQMAYLFYNSIPESEFNEINSISGIPDVPVSNTRYHEILGLYKAGVLTGSDSKGSYYPSDNITRAEAAAIISRVAKPDLRKTFTLENASENTSSDVLTAQQISQNCSPAVAFVKVYDSSNTLTATGSGFFIDSDGTFVTNYHVVDGAASVTVTTTDGQEHKIEGVYDADLSRDTALLKVEGSGFSYLETCTDTITAGDTIYVIGSPRGLENTLSSGLISNISRVIDGKDYIQFSAPISSGSSGGALINEQGKVIGITSASLKDSQTSITQNINFAIPIKYIYDLSSDSLKNMFQLSSLAVKNLTLSVEAISITLAKGESTTIIVTYTPSAEEYLIASSDNPRIASVEWGDNVSDSAAQLTITGVGNGETMVSVYYDINDKYYHQKDIPVSVVGGYGTSSGSSYSSYYRCGAPTYQAVTSLPCLFTYFDTTNTAVNGYNAGGDAFTYYYTYDSFIRYITVLEQEGWECLSSSRDEVNNALKIMFYKNGAYLSVNCMFDYDEVWVIVP